MRLPLLVFACALSLPAATWYVTVAGLGGEPDYEQRFRAWAQDLNRTFQDAADAKVLTLYGADATRARVEAALGSVAKEAHAQDAVVLMLVGHGTYDGVDYKFNLPGPDLTAAELSRQLDRIPAARQLVVNMTSASGACLDVLKKPNRVVITATKTGTEKNATIFARYWVEALRDPAADTDKNDAVSALEAFKYAEQKTAKFYDTEKRLATEHARLDGDERQAAAFTLVRFGSSAAAIKDPAKRQLLAKKEDLEQQIDRLKYQKAAIPADDYKKQLTALLLELARTQAELDK